MCSGLVDPNSSASEANACLFWLIYRLPYVEATILEVMRRKTMAPFSVLHQTLNDTEVGGYFVSRAWNYGKSAFYPPYGVWKGCCGLFMSGDISPRRCNRSAWNFARWYIGPGRCFSPFGGDTLKGSTKSKLWPSKKQISKTLSRSVTYQLEFKISSTGAF